MVSKTPLSRSVIVENVASATVEVAEGILSELKLRDFGEDATFAVHLALVEAFWNALTHGNKMDPGKKIKIDYAIDGDKVEVSIADDGGGFDPSAVPDPRYGENLYRPGGRGLFLIRSYMDEVRFNDSGNCVHMVRYKR